MSWYPGQFINVLGGILNLGGDSGDSYSLSIIETITTGISAIFILLFIIIIIIILVIAYFGIKKGIAWGKTKGKS